MGGEQSKEAASEQPVLKISNIAISNQINNDYGVELPSEVIDLYMTGKIKNMQQFTKTYRAMKKEGYKFTGITQEDNREISKWKNIDSGHVEKRGWRVPK